MNQEHFELLKKVFPTSNVEREGDDIVVDLLLRFSDKEFEAKRIGGSKMIPGFVCILDAGEDETEIDHNPRFDAVVIEAAGWYAKFNARITVDNHNLDAYVKELQEVGEEMKLAEHAPVINLTTPASIVHKSGAGGFLNLDNDYGINEP